MTTWTINICPLTILHKDLLNIIGGNIIGGNIIGGKGAISNASYLLNIDVTIGIRLLSI